MTRVPSHYASLALLILITRTADCFAFHLTTPLAIRRGISDSALSSKVAEVEEKRDVSKLPLPPNQGQNVMLFKYLVVILTLVKSSHRLYTQLPSM